MEPSQILQGLADKYAQCRTYSDNGVVDFDDVKGNKEQIDFKTHFIRPQHFSFEWQDYGPRRGKSTEFSLLWSMNSETLTRYQWGIEEKQDLRMAIAGATGGSAGAAHIVPALLLEEIRLESKHLLQLGDLQLLQNEELDGKDCYVLKGSIFKHHDHTLWISIKDFALIGVYVDKSWTAEESERDHNALLANTELMARLTEKGIAPPTEMKHKDTRFVTLYTYKDVCFDRPIQPLPDPRGHHGSRAENS